MIYALAAIHRLVPASVVAFVLHGTDATTIAVAFAALVYVVSVAKDFRPIKALRTDLAECRKEIVEKDADAAALTVKLAAAEAHVEQLTTSRDFSAALDQAMGKYDDRDKQRSDQQIEAWREVTRTLNQILDAIGTRTEKEPHESHT